jgi:hypothetical protein
MLEVPSGNYLPSELKTTIQIIFKKTPRVTTGTSSTSLNTGFHNVTVDIDNNTDEVTFTPYNDFIVSKPISVISPGTNYILTINHLQHGMSLPGETILIQNAIEDSKIPAEVINGEHQVIEIVDENNYKIKLPIFNLLTTGTSTGGGNNVNILIPDQMKMYFDKTDTIGELLGFRNPGALTSITPFSKKISSKNKYLFDIDTDSQGNSILIENNAINISGERYLIMDINRLNSIDSVGPIKQFFSKLLLCDSPGNILYNSFVSTTNNYEDPLIELAELEIKFRASDGSLFDFNGLEHSFTLEVVTINDIPEGTGINANTGKNYNQKINYY